MPGQASGTSGRNDKGDKVSGASIALETDAEGRRWLRLAGEWRLMALAPRYDALDAELAGHARDAGLGWDLRGIGSLVAVRRNTGVVVCAHD